MTVHTAFSSVISSCLPVFVVVITRAMPSYSVWVAIVNGGHMLVTFDCCKSGVSVDRFVVEARDVRDELVMAGFRAPTIICKP